jgi:predicted deacylase
MTSSLHGDEVNGVRVIHRLFQNELNPEELHGTVVAVVVANLQGFLAGTRGMDGQDLNRLMPGYVPLQTNLIIQKRAGICSTTIRIQSPSPTCQKV